MWHAMLDTRDLFNGNPPAARTRLQDHPTLLFSWWCTGFSLVIILLRLTGRYIRTERFFAEDKIMALSIFPLMIRMAFIHVVLLYGTNNVVASGLSESDIHGRAIGSKMVLVARIFYTLLWVMVLCEGPSAIVALTACSIWTAKFTVSEFLKRLTQRFWKKRYEMTLRGIRIFLFVTFFIVVIATLSECHPFSHFWQVTPDPGPRCRLGYAHLLSMGATDIITDILIVTFPIPIIMKSAMSWKRKFDLIALFSISLVLIAITAARVPSVMQRSGRQQYRTVFASAEILAATAVSNAVVIGSFLRDKGVKKTKRYKYGSTTDSMDRPSIRRPNNVANHHWGSDEDLIRDLGIRLAPELRGEPPLPRPAPAALPASPTPTGMDASWRFPAKQTDPDENNEPDSQSPAAGDPPSPGDARAMPPRRNVSFFDVGGLLEDGPERAPSTISPTTTSEAYDFAAPRRGSRAFLSDIGGLLTQSKPIRSANVHDEIELPARSPEHEGRSPPTSATVSSLARHDKLRALQDVGGLLNERTPHQPLHPSSPPPPLSESSTTAAASRSAHVSRPRRGPAARRDTSPSLQDVGGLLNR